MLAQKYITLSILKKKNPFDSNPRLPLEVACEEICQKKSHFFLCPQSLVSGQKVEYISLAHPSHHQEVPSCLDLK